jgi:tetratricopeptide (TPR) repeat protein
MANVLPPGEIDAFIASHGLLRDRWQVADFGRYKFAFDIDGHANAWGLLEKLILGCCVLKVGSPFEQWYYDRLKPWRDFVPIKPDLSDLADIIAWCRDNEAQCGWIAANGARLAAELTVERDLPLTCRTLMAAAHARPGDRSGAPARRHSEAALPLLLEDAYLRAESEGDLDLAIASHGRLIDIHGGRVDTLMWRHNLLRQRGDFAEAKASLEQAAAGDPPNAEALLRLGQFLASVGRDMAAVRRFERSVSAAPAWAEIRISMAGSCVKLAWLDRAFWTVRETPEDLPGWWADARRDALRAYGAYRAEALAVLAARRAQGSLTEEQTWRLAENLASLGRLKMAWRLCQDAMARSPGLSAPVELACRILARRQGPAEALGFLETASAQGDDRRRFGLQRASLLFELADYDEALAALAASPAQAQETLQARRIAAFSLLFLGRIPALRAHCRAWMAASPADMLPAELVCATSPCPRLPRSASPDTAASVEIVQFWHDQEIPDDVRRIMDTWIDHHPGLRRQVYCLESARAFLISECDAATLQAFDACEDVATKAAYFRFAWLYRRGGVWIDVDQRCIRSAAGTLEAAAGAEIAVVRSGYITGYVETAFLGARAGSTTVETALRRATETILGAVRRGEPIWRWAAVGSGLVTRVVAEHICENESPEGALLLPPFSYESYASTADTLAYKARRRGA